MITCDCSRTEGSTSTRSMSRMSPHADFAVKHYCTVKRFGAIPCRNKVLGRENTPEEQAYLDNPHSSYGQ